MQFYSLLLPSAPWQQVAAKKAPETKLSDSEAKTCAQKLEGTWKTNNVVWGCGNTKIVVDVASNGDTTVDLTRVVFGDIGYVTHSGCVVEDFNHHKSGNEYYKGTVSYTDSYGIWHGQYFYSNYNCDRLSLCTVVYKKQ